MLCTHDCAVSALARISSVNGVQILLHRAPTVLCSSRWCCGFTLQEITLCNPQIVNSKKNVELKYLTPKRVQA